MGGQACVLYGAAEFSRDADVCIVASPANLKRLQAALADLRAERIAVPPFEAQYLERGHAIHFRCNHPEALRLRIDVMSKMRGVAPFEDLWKRRTTLELESGQRVDLLALPDLVAAKKTQRDKDWPMIRRLVEVNYLAFRDKPSADQVQFWLQELRTPDLLVEVVRRYQEAARATLSQRQLLEAALLNDLEGVVSGLGDEEDRERGADRAYWAPLRRELDQLRRSGRSSAQ